VNSIKAMTIEDIEIKKSRFICVLYPLTSEETVLNALDEIKTKYPHATHYCYGYILGDNAEIQRSSDDGEPSKTAGLPILEILKKNDLTNVLAVVIRYFGGIKLGAGGLIRAYSASVKEAIKAAIITKAMPYALCKVATDYGAAGGLEYYLYSITDEVTKQYGGDTIVYTFTIKYEMIERVTEMVNKLSNFRSKLEMIKAMNRYL